MSLEPPQFEVNKIISLIKYIDQINLYLTGYLKKSSLSISCSRFKYKDFSSS